MLTEKSSAVSPNRVIVLALLMTFAVAVVVGQLFRYQVIRYPELKGIADDMVVDHIELTDMRGPIVDRHGHILAMDLVQGVLDTMEEMDRRIASTADHWDVGRMSPVDRNCLRLACYELAYRKEIPFRVVIDEAVEIAKRYGAEGSAAFVNGILDSIARGLRTVEFESLEA